MKTKAFLFLFLFSLLPLHELWAQRPLMPTARADQPDTARARHYFFQARSFAGRSQFDSAGFYFDQAGRIYEKAATRYNHIQLWEALARCYNEHGDVLRKKGEYETAIAQLQLALATGKKHCGDEHLVVGASYGFLGVAYWAKGDYRSAVEFLQKALPIKQRALGGDHPDVAHTLNNLGIVFWAKGDYDAAISYYTQALRIRRKILGEQHLQTASSYNNLGIVFWSKGDYARALDYYKQALAVFLVSARASDPAFANLYNNIAVIYDERGDYDQAIAYYNKTLGLRRQILGEEHDEVAAAYANLGDTYYRQGEYEQAMRHLQKALPIYLKTLGENHPNVAQCYSSMGLVHAARREYEAAIACHQRAQKIYQSIGENHPDLAAGYNCLGQVYAEQGDWDAALKYYDDALALARQTLGERHPVLAETLFKLGELYTRRVDATCALFYYQKALQTLFADFADSSVWSNPAPGRTNADVLVVQTLHAKALALTKLYATEPRERKNLQAALASELLAADLLDQIRLDYKAEGSKLLLAEKAAEVFKHGVGTALRLYQITKDENILQQAFRLAERSKSAVLAEALQESQARQFAGLPDSLLARERTLRVDLAFYETQIQEERDKKDGVDSLQLADFMARQFRLQTQYEMLVENLEKNYPKYHALKYQTATTDLVRLQAAIAPNEVLLEYFTGDSAISIFAVAANSFKVKTVAKDKNFDQLVTAFLRALKKIEKVEFVKSSRALHQLLITPVQDEIAAAKKLIIIPDGVLAYVPFEALVAHKTPATGNGVVDFSKLDYLIRRHEISYHYSATLYQKSFTESKSLQNDGFLGFAPVFSDSVKNGYVLTSAGDSTLLVQLEENLRAVMIDGKRYGELKFTETEVAAIAKLFEQKKKPGKGYFHREASEENFKQAAAGYKYLHLATHGLLNEEYPKLSGLIFSQPADSGKGDDGILYAGETFNLVTNADLVVLSSCESGLGKLVQGEGLMALTRGFLYAGAPNLVVSLWKVYDKHTGELMVEFYKNILAGKNYSAALREAKLRLLREPTSAFPQKWSAFVLVGR